MIFVLGMITGALLTAFGGWLAMRKLMLVTHRSSYDSVDETCSRLTGAIESSGWSSPATRNMNEMMARHGVEMEKPVRIVELCKAEYAKKVLTTNPEVSTLMPCALGVYEGNDGKVYISGMNIGLMAKMFGGNIAKVMGNSVAGDEKRILTGVVSETA